MFEVTASVLERDVEFSLALDEGETVALLGPNGAGKSTFLQVIAGLLRPDAGRAELRGRVLFDAGPMPGAPDASGPSPRRGAARRRPLRPHERGAALLAQDPLLFPHLSARDNVAFGPRSTGTSAREAHRIADEWLERVDVASLADRHPAELSGGQAQRVAIARALATTPSLLLLDEPMAALDVSVAPSVRRLLRDVLAERTAVIVTHDVLDAITLADRVVLVEAGRVVDTGPTRAVLERPTTPFAAGFAGVNLLTGVAHADGTVETDAGYRLSATPLDDEPFRAGELAGVSVRPSHVTIIGDAGEHPVTRAPDAVAGIPSNGTTNVVTATVTDLEPRDDSIRVRSEALAADVPFATAADLDLAPGTAAKFVFESRDAVVYRL